MVVSPATGIPPLTIWRDYDLVVTGQRERTRDAIEQLCLSATDDRTLRAQILQLVQKVLPFDAYVWLLTDPVTAVGSAPLAEVPCLPRLPMLIKLKYLTVTNRWTELRRGPKPVGLLQGASGEPTRSLLWRELLCELGIGDVASVVFADRHGCWGFLDLWRQGDQHFSTTDADWLAGLAATITRALRRRQAAAFNELERAIPPVDGPAVLVLDDHLRINSRTTAATAWLRSLLPTAPGMSPIPASAYNVAAQLLANEAGIDTSQPSARSRVAGGTWLTLRASRLEADAEPLAAAGDLPRSGGIAVSIEETAAGPRLDLFARSHGLSDRETQVLELVSRAVETRDIASTMFITEYTVQDHLKSIFHKTTLNSRNALILTAIGPYRGADGAGRRAGSS
ncbi:MAG: LuxR C-terminal-related transcriptional regulator [Nakamurella sp.]